MIKFIHCADLHLGAPFRAVKRNCDQQLSSLIAESPLLAWQNVVIYAKRERVNFIIIAGDIFDNSSVSLKTKVAFKKSLEDLQIVNIKVFIVAGNHDLLTQAYDKFELPENVKLFGSRGVEFVDFCDELRIYGISHDEVNGMENLALKFDHIKQEKFTIGILHANIGKNSNYEAYAPANLSDLRNQNIDYWALGHIHDGGILYDNRPVIAYSGAVQGLNINQSGEKGGYLVTIEDNEIAKMEFVSFSVINFARINLDLSKVESLSDFTTEIEKVSRQCLQKNLQAKKIFLELILCGRTPFNKTLRAEESDNLEELVINCLDKKIFLNQLTLNTTTQINEVELLQNNPLLSDIFSSIDEKFLANQAFLQDKIQVIRKKFKLLDKFTDEELSDILSAGKIELMNIFVD